MSELVVTATVRVLVEVSASGSWGEKCSIDQVRKQAGESALANVNKAIKAGGLRAKTVGVADVREVSVYLPEPVRL